MVAIYSTFLQRGYDQLIHDVALQNLDVTSVTNRRFIKPFDAALVAELAASHDLLVTIEEACVMGGAGSAVAEALAASVTQRLGKTEPRLVVNNS